MRDLDHLEDLLSEPSEGVIDTCRRLDGDVLVLGVGGKMGPSLSRMMRRASDAAGAKRRIIGVSRFAGGTSRLQRQLNDWGIETIACDLLDQAALDRLPDTPNVVYMTGMKFGTTGQQSLTWAMNGFLPSIVCQRFSRSRIVAFSSGNIYAMSAVCSGGPTEGVDTAPVGEYGMSVLARERMFEHFSRTLKIPVTLLRLNYAVEMRYGVLVDLATKVWRGQPIDVSMGVFNVIWQGDANAQAIQSFDHVASPPRVLNITGPETLSVRALAEAFGRAMGKQPAIVGTEAATALLNNAQLSHRLFGYPRVPIQQVVEWTAEWVMKGGVNLDRPTHFETRDGRF
ncbi:NAD(P)-dependent oxidoreductase [Humisphaera borealis]|uniref:NAD(P)-dependent oxidoreductase n=1 Tax=Humisphaera borealis TaxID=2807512 RepID=A0A7M2X4F4_9BACT|nr:NAD(P)-dependent oxidoreductase [Humisphaera borealis]